MSPARGSLGITLDVEFANLIPPLTTEESNGLEESLLAEGCRDPLVLWAGHGILVDGHNRFDICQRHEIEYQTVERAFETRDDVKQWIIRNQLGRRNLNPTAASLLRGILYNAQKKEPHDGGKGGERSGGQNVPNLSQRTSERLAEEHGITEKTIRRDGQFAAAVETLKPVIPDIEQRVLSGDIPGKQEVIDAAKKPETAAQALPPKSAHVSHNSGQNEWYTPACYIEAARAVMGGIDCDPASSDLANKTVRADEYFTAEQDGLKQPWGRRCWMNPPYAQPLIAQFSAAMVEKYESGEVEQGIMLVNNATDTEWCQGLMEAASAVCFVRRRIKFIDMDGNASGAPLQGQIILYFGCEHEVFAGEFGQFGIVMVKPLSVGF